MVAQAGRPWLKAEPPEKLTPWFRFSKCKPMIDLHGYPPSLIFNMNETGFDIGASQSMRVLAVLEVRQKGIQKARKASPSPQEWVTSIECVSPLVQPSNPPSYPTREPLP